MLTCKPNLIKTASLFAWICLPSGCDFPPGYIGSKDTGDVAEDEGGTDTDRVATTSGKTSFDSTDDGAGDTLLEETGPLVTTATTTDVGSSSESGTTLGDSSYGTYGTYDPSATDGATDGAPPYPTCASLIDDLEDGDEWISPIAGRSGDWYVYNDTSGTQVPTLGSGLPSLTGHNLDGYAAVTSGSGFDQWGAGIGLNFNLGAAYDASQYQGIAFRGSSETEQIVRLKVSTTDTLAVADGGGCTDLCSDFHGANFALRSAGGVYFVPFADLAQEGFGSGQAFDLTRIHDLLWQVSTDPAGFEFAIDDVCFF